MLRSPICLTEAPFPQRLSENIFWPLTMHCQTSPGGSCEPPLEALSDPEPAVVAPSSRAGSTAAGRDAGAAALGAEALGAAALDAAAVGAGAGVAAGAGEGAKGAFAAAVGVGWVNSTVAASAPAAMSAAPKIQGSRFFSMAHFTAAVARRREESWFSCDVFVRAGDYGASREKVPQTVACIMTLYGSNGI